MERPLLFAPAMNKHMWLHPLTATHISTLRSFGYEEIPVVDRVLLCGDKGKVTVVAMNLELYCMHLEKYATLCLTLAV